MEVMALVAAECRARGADPAAVLISPRQLYHHEPPRAVARAMEASDVVITMTLGSLWHTQAREAACAAGAKFATLGGASPEYLARLNLTRDDLFEVRRLTEGIAQRLSEASSARLTTKAGTDLHLSLKGRKGIALVPFGVKGSFCVIPDYAEATCPPLEDSVEGVAVIDGTMVGGEADFEGLVEFPFEAHFEKGRLKRISGGPDGRRLENLLNSLGEGARAFAELGVGSNHKISRKLIGTRADNARAGHVHLGLGRNDFLGGESRAKVHLDILVQSPTLLLDGVPILEDGNLKI